MFLCNNLVGQLFSLYTNYRMTKVFLKFNQASFQLPGLVTKDCSVTLMSLSPRDWRLCREIEEDRQSA